MPMCKYMPINRTLASVFSRSPFFAIPRRYVISTLAICVISIAVHRSNWSMRRAKGKGIIYGWTVNLIRTDVAIGSLQCV